MGGSAACGKQKPEEKHKNKIKRLQEENERLHNVEKNRKAMFNYCLYKMETHKKVKSCNCWKGWEVEYLELEYYSLIFFLCSIHSKLE